MLPVVTGSSCAWALGGGSCRTTMSGCISREPSSSTCSCATRWQRVRPIRSVKGGSPSPINARWLLSPGSCRIPANNQVTNRELEHELARAAASKVSMTVSNRRGSPGHCHPFRSFGGQLLCWIISYQTAPSLRHRMRELPMTSANMCTLQALWGSRFEKDRTAAEIRAVTGTSARSKRRNSSSRFVTAWGRASRPRGVSCCASSDLFYLGSET